MRKEGEFPRRSNENYRSIERLRVLQWETNTWLFEIIRAADPEEPDYDPDRADYYYLPLNLAFEHERQMIDQLKRAFDRGHRIKLNWRESYFFAEYDDQGQFQPRKMAVGVRVRPA